MAGRAAVGNAVRAAARGARRLRRGHIAAAGRPMAGAPAGSGIARTRASGTAPHAVPHTGWAVGSGTARAAVPAALLATALAAGVTACGGVSASGTSAGHGGAHPAASAGTTPGTSAGRTPGSVAASGAPDAGRLQTALLTAHDIGLQSSPSSPAAGGGVRVSGCEPLAAMLTTPAPGQTQRQASFVGDAAGGPFVQESLTTEAQSRMTADYAKLRGALEACRSLTFTVGGTKLTMALTPIDFGGAGSAAKRMDTTVQGVEVNGYLAVDRIGPVVLGYAYLQAGSGSSQLASYYYRQAVAKATHVFGGGPTIQAAGRPA